MGMFFIKKDIALQRCLAVTEADMDNYSAIH